MLKIFRRPAAVLDPGWRAPNELIAHIAALTLQLGQARALYADSGAQLDHFRKALIEARAEAAELRHLPEENRRLKGSLDLARARNTDLARDLRQAREHLDRCARWEAVEEEAAAKRYADGLGDGQ